MSARYVLGSVSFFRIALIAGIHLSASNSVDSFRFAQSTSVFSVRNRRNCIMGSRRKALAASMLSAGTALVLAATFISARSPVRHGVGKYALRAEQQHNKRPQPAG